MLSILYKLNYNVPFDIYDLLFWGILFSWSQLIAVQLISNASFSHLFIFILSALVVFPPWVVPLLVLLFYLNPSMISKNAGYLSYTWYKDVFNRLQIGLSAAAAALVYSIITHSHILFGGHDISQIISILMSSVVLFVVEISLVSLAVYLTTHTPFKDIWFHNFGWIVVSYMLMTPVALLLARLYTATPPLLGNWGGWSVILFLIPLYYARFHWDEAVKMREAFDKTVDLVSNTIDARDSHTYLHSQRVAVTAVEMAKAYGLDAAKINTIEKGARIHDIGKIGIPDSVLFKPGMLTDIEYGEIKKHPVFGVELLQPASNYIRETFDIIKYHHERWDGRGYPEGLAGHEIPLFARIVSIADAYEAMTAGRPYQEAKTPERALAEIEDLAGVQFDPKLVKLFREVWEVSPNSWRDREVFIRLYSSKVPSLGSSSRYSSEPEAETSPESS